MSDARRVLERLLRRAESARRRGADERVSQPMATAGAYASLRTLEALDGFHAEIALAERAGAIRVTRDWKGGDGSRLLRLQVADLQRLARHLGVRLLDERCAEAAARLESWLPRFPVIADVLEAWRQGRRVRGGDAAAAPALADAAKLVAARLEDAGHERIVRRESARLFGDSKRIEALSPWLEILVAGELAASGRAVEETWAEIGLRREPQPLLLAGSGTIALDGGRVPLVRPFIGVPMESVRSVDSAASWVLTVENLASFHDAARDADAASGLLLYTGGMPSPAWRAAYARILAALPPRVPVYHWGDIDEGGFRIAAVLARTAADAGRALRPWLMSPAALEEVPRPAAVPQAPVLGAMCRWAGRAGWPDVAAALAARPLQLEQECLRPRLPRAEPALAPG